MRTAKQLQAITPIVRIVLSSQPRRPAFRAGCPGEYGGYSPIHLDHIRLGKAALRSTFVFRFEGGGWERKKVEAAGLFIRARESGTAAKALPNQT